MTSPANLGDQAEQLGSDPDELYEAFADWAGGTGVELYPHQVEALIELLSGANVILATPTGSGKSLVATGAHFAALAQGRRSFYTAPIKALVSEKFFALCAVFGTQRVGMLTGDASVNPTAPIICCTAEVLANVALREGPAADIGVVVMDEFHYYGDPDRGWAWQIPLLELTNCQFLLMSATLGDVSFFRDDLTRRTQRDTAVVAGVERPVPLFYYYRLAGLQETVLELIETHQSPVYVVHFTQASAIEQAQALTSIKVASREQRDQIAETIAHFRFRTGFGKTLNRLIRHGIGVHHAGMLPKYRRLVEQLAQGGLLEVICGTDTLGVGINVPIRTVVLTSLSKYDGQRTRQLQAREFHQISGRAGRAGFDTAGTVVVQGPEHEIENAKLLAKAGDDEKKRKRVQRKKAPEGFVSWSQNTSERLQQAEPEPLTSHFAVTPSLVLNVLARQGDPVQAMRRLLTDNHEPLNVRKHVRSAIQIYRSLLTAGVIERLPEPDADGRTIRLTVDLPANFALNQPLSTFALAALELLDPAGEQYALDALSVIESTLDDPRQILMAQQSQARGEAVAAMKADGISYEERMQLLEQVTYPKPLAELLEAAFTTYRQGHPWLLGQELSPKSVVRDMYERAMTFSEYVAFYGLNRSEGLVLRYLSDAYRTLHSGVPAAAQTEELSDLTVWLGELVRQTDSSLLDEWEQLAEPDPEQPDREVAPPSRELSDNTRAFTILIRNAMFRRVELAARSAYAELAALDDGWDEATWREALGEYYAEYDRIGIGPVARSRELFQLTPGAGVWSVRQVLDDPAGDRDWAITAEVDVAASNAGGEAVIRLLDVAPA